MRLFSTGLLNKKWFVTLLLVNEINNVKKIAQSFSGAHEYYIHDIKYDLYGQRMATCSSDNRIKIWDIDNDKWKFSYDWKVRCKNTWLKF